MTAPGVESAALASVAGARFDYADQAAEALLALGETDPRCEPGRFEDSVRALLAGWVGSVDADRTPHGPVRVRDPRIWLIFVSGPVDGAAPPGLVLSVYVAGSRWVEGPEPDPAEDTSMAAAEHWNFVQEWELALDDHGPWRWEEAPMRTLEDVLGYRFVSRRETPAEHEARTGSAAPDTVPTTRRFLLQASMQDYAAYYGGQASAIVERATAPTRLEAEALLQPAMQAQMRRDKGEADYQPTVTALESHELLD